MPRHRIETPRSRTLWSPAEQSAPRVQLHAASRRKTASHAKPSVTPEWRRRLTRSQRRMLKGAGNRLVVSPWFAVGAGVVIATGALIYTPHANLDFGRAIEVTQCKHTPCVQTVPAGPNPGIPAGAGAGQLTPSPSTSSALAGMTFSYQVVERNQFGFIMLITIHAPHSLGQWKVSFQIPGAYDVFVLQARWQQSGTSGGTASNYIGGTESAGFAPISGNWNGGDGGSSQNSDSVQFTVHGSGTPHAPTSCLYDGEYVCHFQVSSGQSTSSQGA